MSNQSQEGRAALLERAIRRKRATARTRRPGLPPRPAEHPAVLGELQRSLWLLHHLDPESCAYNLVQAFRTRTTPRREALERALQQVVDRHRILRSTFRADGDRVLQIITPEGRGTASVEGFEVEPGAATAAAVREARQPFDLSRGPLLRLLWIEERGTSAGLLVLVMHHILADERSLGIFWRELTTLYRGETLAAETPAQLDDLVCWQASQSPAARESGLRFWRERLTPFPEELRLPFETPPGAPRADGTPPGKLLTRSIPSGIRQEIRRVAASAGTTPFVVLAFVFRLLLHRYTEGRAVAFATPASQRSHPATAEMIGYFLNSVVVPTTVDESETTASAVRAFGEEMGQLLAHGSVPFDTLVEALEPPRDGDRHPIFQTLYVYQEIPPPPRLDDVLEPLALDLGESKLDLTLFASEPSDPAGSLEIAAEFRTDRYEDVWIHNLLGHYETLLRHLAAGLGRPTAELPWLTPDEEIRLRAAAQGPPLPTPEPGSPLFLPEQIFRQALECPEAPAVLADGKTTTYRELVRTAHAIARGLVDRGVTAGDRVGLFADRSAAMIAGLLGCHWAGAAYVPLDPAYPEARNRGVLADAEVSAVLVGSRRALPAVDAGPLLLEIGGFAAGSDTFTLEELGPLVPPRSEQPAYLLYTSGSTGRPKGTVIEHGNLAASNGARFIAYEEPPERFLLLSSIAFDSSVAGLFWTLASGGALVLPAEEEATDPRRLVQLVGEHRVTALLCVPSLYRHLLAAGSRTGGLESLRTAIVAGESCSRALVAEHFRSLPRARLYNEYGPTEATVWATKHEMTPDDADRDVSIGQPIPGVALEVLDTHGRRTPAGVPGQGWISGPTLASGYWQRPELDAERFPKLAILENGAAGPPERRYRTADRMAWTLDGRLLFLGRADEQLKVRGFRIEPGEVESALVESPEVDAAAVVVHKEQLVAFVVLGVSGEAGEPGSPARELPSGPWRDRLAERLPEFMIPGRFFALPHVPLLPNGKVDRRRLRSLSLPSPISSGERPEVLDPAQQILVSLWEGLLGRAGVSLDDNFFQLGGHSLLAVELATAIEADLGVALAPADIFQHPTVRGLARRIEQQGGGDAPSYTHLFPLQPGGRGAPFVFAIPHFFSALVAERFRGERPVYGLRGVGLRPEGNRGRWPTMADLGRELVDEIRFRFPDDGVYLAGYSFGASMAFEATRRLEELGIPVHGLYLIAPMPLDFFSLGPLRLQLDSLRQPVEELTTGRALGRYLRGNHPFSPRLYQRLRWLLLTQPRRWLLCQLGAWRRRAGQPLAPAIQHADVRLERFRLHSRYRPGPIHTPTTIFNAREPDTDSAATWRPYCQGPVTVVPIADPHLDEAAIGSAQEEILRHLRTLGPEGTR